MMLDNESGLGDAIIVGIAEFILRFSSKNRAFFV
jgi:hypothetical protein